jgi:hypothetical protein
MIAQPPAPTKKRIHVVTNVIFIRSEIGFHGLHLHLVKSVHSFQQQFFLVDCIIGSIILRRTSQLWLNVPDEIKNNRWKQYSIYFKGRNLFTHLKRAFKKAQPKNVVFASLSPPMSTLGMLAGTVL